MGRKETEEAIAGSRAGRVTRIGSVAELLVELSADDVLPEATAGWLPTTAGTARTG